MTVTRVPAATPKPAAEFVHWFAGESTMTWSNPVNSIACDPDHAQADFDPKTADTRQDKVTCPACLSVVMRRRCLVMEDAPGPLPRRCTFKPHDDGPHSWLRDDLDTARNRKRAVGPSGLLPVRVPGAALGDVSDSGGVGVPENAAGASEGEFEREVLETWKA